MRLIRRTAAAHSRIIWLHRKRNLKNVVNLLMTYSTLLSSGSSVQKHAQISLCCCQILLYVPAHWQLLRNRGTLNASQYKIISQQSLLLFPLLVHMFVFSDWFGSFGILSLVPKCAASKFSNSWICLTSCQARWKHNGNFLDCLWFF